MSTRRNEEQIPAVYSVLDAKRQGLTRTQWSRHNRYLVQRGVYAKTGETIGLNQYLLVAARSMPGAALASISAAHLLGLRLPARFSQLRTYIVLPEGAPIYRRRGVTRICAPVAAEEITTFRGITLTTYERTFFDLAKVLTLDELVAVADGLLVAHRHRRKKPLLTRQKLEAYLEGKSGRAGVKKCRAALELAVTGSDSVKETELRLLLQRHGIEGLVCNEPVVNEVGWVLFEPDLALPHLGISIQYDGAHHGNARQHQRDIERQQRTLDAGWVEVRIAVRDLNENILYGQDLLPRAVVKVLQAIEQARGG